MRLRPGRARRPRFGRSPCGPARAWSGAEAQPRQPDLAGATTPVTTGRAGSPGPPRSTSAMVTSTPTLARPLLTPRACSPAIFGVGPAAPAAALSGSPPVDGHEGVPGTNPASRGVASRDGRGPGRQHQRGRERGERRGWRRRSPTGSRDRRPAPAGLRSAIWTPVAAVNGARPGTALRERRRCYTEPQLPACLVLAWQSAGCPFDHRPERRWARWRAPTKLCVTPESVGHGVWPHHRRQAL